MSREEKFIQDYTRNCSNEIIGGGWNNGEFVPLYHPWLTPDQARSAVEIAREEELEYIKYQLDLKLPETLDYNGIKVNRKDFINDFTEALKDE